MGRACASAQAGAAAAREPRVKGRGGRPPVSAGFRQLRVRQRRVRQRARLVGRHAEQAQQPVSTRSPSGRGADDGQPTPRWTRQRAAASGAAFQSPTRGGRAGRWLRARRRLDPPELACQQIDQFPVRPIFPTRQAVASRRSGNAMARPWCAGRGHGCAACERRPRCCATGIGSSARWGRNMRHGHRVRYPCIPADVLWDAGVAGGDALAHGGPLSWPKRASIS